VAPVPKEDDEDEIPRMVMEPRYAMREGQEAADHASRQPYGVPLSRYNAPVAGNPQAALGQYVPRRQISNNPLAQFIPNITYWPNGDIVPFWDGECEPDDVECELWKAKGYDNGDVVMPNPMEHGDHDSWGLPLDKFGEEMKSENRMIMGEMRIEQEEMAQGVPKNVAEADAEAVLKEVAQAGGLSPGAAKLEAEKAMMDKKILEAAHEGEVSNEQSEQAEAALVTEEQESKTRGIEEMQAQLVEEERISAASIAKQNKLKAAMESMRGGEQVVSEPAVEGVVEAPQVHMVEAPQVPMFTSVGPAGEFTAEGESAAVIGQPVAAPDIEVCEHLLIVYLLPLYAVSLCRLSFCLSVCPYAHTQDRQTHTNTHIHTNTHTHTHTHIHQWYQSPSQYV